MAKRRTLAQDHVRGLITDFAKKHPGIWFLATDAIGPTTDLFMLRTAWMFARTGVFQERDLVCWECASKLWISLNATVSLPDALRAGGYAAEVVATAKPIEVSSG